MDAHIPVLCKHRLCPRDPEAKSHTWSVIFFLPHLIGGHRIWEIKLCARGKLDCVTAATWGVAWKFKCTALLLCAAAVNKLLSSGPRWKIPTWLHGFPLCPNAVSLSFTNCLAVAGVIPTSCVCSLCCLLAVPCLWGLHRTARDGWTSDFEARRGRHPGLQ